jgi:hypothetical protein
LFLTVNGLNPAIAPYTIQETTPVIIAVDGNTTYEPNDITVTAENGILSAIPDTNGQYHFEFDANSEIATVTLTAKADIIIDTRTVPAGTTIYKLYVFYNSDDNTNVAFGIGLEELITLEEEEEKEEQNQPTDSQPVMATNVELPAIEATASEPAIKTDYNLPVRQPSILEQYKFKVYCPNSIDAEMNLPFLHTQADSIRFRQAPAMERNMLLSGFWELTENIIEINSDITTNQIWTADNVYYITAPISVQALLVIEPGTVVEFTYAPIYITVENGGTLISAGTPDKPIIYTCDFLYPDSIGYYFFYIGYQGPWYYYTIYIDETASPSTTVTYSFMEGAYVGILTNNITLEHSIENNYLAGNYYGISEYGTRHTDIINNMCLNNYIAGIDVDLGDVNGMGDSNSFINIINNTCDSSFYWGIGVHGVANQEQAGGVFLNNNIVSESGGYGQVLADGWLYFIIANTGYFGNGYYDGGDRYGYEEWQEYNPVYEYVMPYVMGDSPMDWCYLRQDCAFMNASNNYIEQTRLVGKSTDINGFPDSNKTDLGFHYPNWQFSNAGDGNTLESDLNRDGIVNFIDFASLAADWPDVNDIYDLDTMADDWLKTANIHPNVEIIISGDSNNGYVDVGTTGYSVNTLRSFLLVDGQYAGEIMFYDDEQLFHLDTSALSTGPHELKVISINDENEITCSNLAQIDLNCPFRYCVANENYMQNQPYYFGSFYHGSDNINVKVYDEDNILVWSQTYPAQNVNGYIPSSITSRDDLDKIVFESTASGASVSTSLSIIFIPWLVPSNIRALILLPDAELNEGSKNIVEAVEQAFEYRNVPCYKLKLKNASYQNLKWFALNRNIEYIYFNGHGNYLVGQIGYDGIVRRTKIKLSDGTVVSAKQSDFGPGGAPPWCEKLPGTLENTMHSMTGIYFVHGLKFVYFESCFSGLLRLTSDNRLVLSDQGSSGLPDGPQSDMSWAMGNMPDSFYQGWREKCDNGTPFSNFSIYEWNHLRDGESIYYSLYDTIQDMAMVQDQERATQTFRIYGLGDMFSFVIE